MSLRFMIPTTFVLLVVFAAAVVHAQDDTVQHSTEVVDITLSDNEVIKGQLYLPKPENNKAINTLVIFVHGTGPGTYLTKRKSGDKVYNYFDYWGKEFNNRGIAFFSYNKRGVTMGEKPPYYDEVDRDKFRKVVPHVEVADLATIIDQLKSKDRLGKAKVSLLGGSEGTVIAAMAAEAYPEKIDSIMLFGYAHENMYDIITWQHSGAGSMMNLNPVFDADDDGAISKSEYESEDAKIARYRKLAMQNVKFEFLDANKDEKLSAEDFAIRLKMRHNLLMNNLASGNEDGIWNYYFRISIPWLKEHFQLEPNKTRLTRLELPIFIFHGELDPNVDVNGVRDLQERFKALGKENLNAFIFPDHEHNLNFSQWRRDGVRPDGIKKVFEMASKLDESDIEAPAEKRKNDQ